jgi:hypothetical protein
MEFSLEGRCVLELEHKAGSKISKHVQTKFALTVSKNLDSSKYNDKDGNLTKEGSHVLTNVFVQGLIGNIHLAHKEGFRNDAEHLRYIISELERGFIENVEVGTGKF